MHSYKKDRSVRVSDHPDVVIRELCEELLPELISSDTVKGV